MTQYVPARPDPARREPDPYKRGFADGYHGCRSGSEDFTLPWQRMEYDRGLVNGSARARDAIHPRSTY